MVKFKLGDKVKFEKTRGLDKGIFLGGSEKGDWAWILTKEIKQKKLSWYTIGNLIVNELILVNYSELKKQPHEKTRRSR
jgi:hypothetical protein